MLLPDRANERHIVYVSGKDSLATLIYLLEHEPYREYEVWFCDTGAELPDVFSWLAKIEAKFGVTIRRIGRNLVDVIYEMGMLPSNLRRYCTRMVKIYPSEDALGTDPATVYIGLRADENRGGYSPSRPNIIARYPLQEAGYGVNEVYSLVNSYDLPPPCSYGFNLKNRYANT